MKNIPRSYITPKTHYSFRDSSVVDDAIREFKKEFFTSLRSVHKLTTPINKSFVIDEEILKGSISLSAEIDKLNDPRQNFLIIFKQMAM